MLKLIFIKLCNFTVNEKILIFLRILKILYDLRNGTMYSGHIFKMIIFVTIYSVTV